MTPMTGKSFPVKRHLPLPEALRNGATHRIRTDDLLITNELLYQLS